MTTVVVNLILITHQVQISQDSDNTPKELQKKNHRRT